MAEKSTTLQKIAEALPKALLQRIENGEATAADLSVARQLLRDNNIQVGNVNRNESFRRLTEALPFEEAEDDAAVNN